MKSQHLLVLLVAVSVSITIHGNSEGDALNAWKSQLMDPNNVLSSWDPTLINPCTWFHITCNNNNSVTRVDLGSAELSGTLVPELARLTNLQYLEVFGNKLSGLIPPEIGGLTELVSLDLYNNYFTGPIPQSLANLTSLRFLRLNSNKLTGNIPREIILLIGFGNLRIVNISDNYLAGTVAGNSSERFAVTTIITDPKAQMS